METQDTQIEDPEEQVDYDLSDSNDILLIFLNKLEEKRIQQEITKYLNKIAVKYSLDYNILFLFDTYTPLSNHEADKLYKAIQAINDKKDILLILNNLGGSIEPAYLISQTCKKSSKNKFAVVIPRRAKSAATLLSLGADEVHMGMMSELGPIDPQINNLPALGLGNSLEYIAKVVCNHPGSASMFAQYLSTKLELNTLGYFERVSESAMQYAERLIGNKKMPGNESAKSIAEKLVYHYKDHSFVIDIEEAKSLLGGNIIKEFSPEYSFGNEVYELFNVIARYSSIIAKKSFTYVGSAEKGLKFYEQSE